MKTLGRLPLIASLVAGLIGFTGSLSFTHAENDDSGTKPLLVEVRESEPKTPSPTPPSPTPPSPTPSPTKPPSQKPGGGDPGDKTPGSWIPGVLPGDDPGAAPTPGPTDGSTSGDNRANDPKTGGGSGGQSSGSGETDPGQDGESEDDKQIGPGAEPDGSVAGEVSSDGIIYVGALSSQYQWSINPFGGSLALFVPIRNASPDPVTAIAIFTVSHFFGGRVGQKDIKFVINLEPGESTIITGHVGSMAQWTFVNTEVTVSRVGSDDAWGLGSVTRDHWVFFFPWFIALVVVLLAAGAIWRKQRRKANATANQSDPNSVGGSNLGDGGEPDPEKGDGFGPGEGDESDPGEGELGTGIDSEAAMEAG